MAVEKGTGSTPTPTGVGMGTPSDFRTRDTPPMPVSSGGAAIDSSGGIDTTGRLNQVPPGSELWFDHATGRLFLMFPTNDIPLLWHIPSMDDLEAMLGRPVNDLKGLQRDLRNRPVPLKFLEFRGGELQEVGAVEMGATTEIVQDFTGDPFETWLARYEKSAELKPWLADPEMVALHAGAFLEGWINDIGRMEEAFASTEWWRTHSANEREWLRLSNADPTEAARRMVDQRRIAAGLLRESGVFDPPDSVVNMIANRTVTGAWTPLFAAEQIRKLSDPFAPGELHPDFADLTLDTTRARENDVRRLVDMWAGPAASRGWTDDQYKFWAGQLRNDPDAEIRLIENLRAARVARFPGYDDSLTYEDIASVWRPEFLRLWGQVPDETDPIFQRVLKLNDQGETDKLLIQEGRRRDNPLVTNRLLGELGDAFGGGVRRADAAIR
jgi:hypothetical protein